MRSGDVRLSIDGKRLRPWASGLDGDQCLQGRADMIVDDLTDVSKTDK